MEHRTHLIQQLEEFSLSAWPALKTIYYDGWVLRFAGGYTRRANSINPVYASTLAVDDKITHCKTLFKAQGIRPVFKMTDSVHPSELDALLAERGFEAEAHTSTQIVDLDGRSFDGAITIDAQCSDEWITHYVSLNNVDPAHVPTMKRMLDNMALAAGFAQIVDGGEVVAVGLGVAGLGFVALFDIVTAPHRRNEGYGRRLVGGLLRWGQAQGAQRGFLQVMADNAPALHLYQSLGFHEVYRYWYRA